MIKKAFDSHNVEVVLVQNSEPIDTKGLVDKEFFVSEKEKYFNKLKEVIIEDDIDFCISTSGYDELTVLDSFVGEICRIHNVNFIGQSYECSNICWDKWQTKEMLKLNEVSVLDNLLCENHSVLLKSIESFNTPIVIKNIKGISGKHQKVIFDKKKLEGLSDLVYPVILEPFIEGTEYSIDIFSHNNKHIVYPPIYKGEVTTDNFSHPMLKLRVTPPPNKNELLNKLIEKGIRVSKAIKSTGWVNIDMIVSNNKIYVLEVNARFSGTTRITYMATEINPYKITLEAAIGKIDKDRVIESKNVAIEFPIYKKIKKHLPFVNIYYTSTHLPAIGRATVKLVKDKPLPEELIELMVKAGSEKYIKDIENLLSL